MSEVKVRLTLGWTEGAYLFREQGSRDQEMGALLKGAGPHIAQVSKVVQLASHKGLDLTISQGIGCVWPRLR